MTLRIKFLLVAGGVAIIALGSAMWALSYQLESQLVSRIGRELLAAERTFVEWRHAERDHLRAEARIVAHDPRFFAAIAEGDAATAVPVARQFQRLAGSDIFLVCDRRGRPLAHLDTDAELRSFDWPLTMPPTEDRLRRANELYLLQSQAITVGADTIGYVALGRRVDAVLAHTMGRIAGADVVFFDGEMIFGTTLPPSRGASLVGHLAAENPSAGFPGDEPMIIRLDDERFLYRRAALQDGAAQEYAVLTSLDEQLEPRIADLRSTLTWVGSLALILAVLISWSAGRGLTASIPRLVAAVEAVARGDYDQPVVHKGHDELHTVAQAVDRMRHELAAQIEAIRRANSEKLDAERLAVIGKMASTIIHDFKTPMQVIRGAIELATAEKVTADRRAKYAAMVFDELDRMVGMTRDLLEFARGERRMARTDVNLDNFMGAAVDTWQQICSDRGLRLEFVPGAAVRVAIDPDKIRRTLDNIVVNATEVLNEGGQIAIGTTHDAESVVITITDSGPGIPEEIRDRIFEPFATFGKAQGTGLGLAVARKTVEDHGGTISVVSGPGMGTTFTLTLPRGRGADGVDADGRDVTEGIESHVSTVF